MFMEEETEVTIKKEAETKVTVKKEIKAKNASLYAKILAVIIVVAGHILKWCGVLPMASSSEICLCGITVMGIFGTVDLNILADKFTGRR